MQHLLRSLRERRDDRDGGFTLIELLVVVVIIGILVAIAIPVYLNYRKGAADKAAQSDVRSTVTAIEAYFTKYNSTYPDAANVTGGGSGQQLTLKVGAANPETVNISAGTTLDYKIAGGTYTVCGYNINGNVSNQKFTYKSVDGTFAPLSACP